MWFVYTMDYYSAIRKDEYLPFTLTWMELEDILLNKMSQSEKDNYQIVPLICGMYKKQCRGQQKKAGNTKWEEIKEGDKPYETLDSGKQTEGCGKGGVWWDGITG